MTYTTPDLLRKRILEIGATYLNSGFQYSTLDEWKQMDHEEFSEKTEKLFHEIRTLVHDLKYPHTFESTAKEISRDYPHLKPVLNELLLQQDCCQQSGELILRQLHNYHRIL